MRRGERDAWAQFVRDADGAVPVPREPRKTHAATPSDLEHKIQTSAVNWSRLSLGKYPELAVLYAIPNGGHRHPAVGVKLKKEGVLAGMPDLCLPVPRGGFGALYIEVKTPDGYTSKYQDERIEELRRFGNRVEICYSVEEIIRTLVDYLEELSS